MERLADLISIIKFQKRVPLTYLDDLSLKVKNQHEFNFSLNLGHENKMQETTGKIIVKELDEKITENELRAYFG